MGRQELDNLVAIKKLKAEPASRKEFEAMLASARRGLKDAQVESIETDSRFTLAKELRTVSPWRHFGSMAIAR